ncbi:MAG: GNAT family N-acetyltransferase [Candidatus Acidiferrales bacterium]
MSARPTPIPPRPRSCSAALQGGIAARQRSGIAVQDRSSDAGLKPGATSPRYIARRARAADAEAVHALIAYYAAQGLLLPRSEEDVRAHIDHFLVLSLAGRAAGCVALEHYGAALAEIRSLAVAPAHAGNGRGARLVRFALAVAKRRKIARVFAVTHAPEFFQRLGFAPADRRSITEKVERDCRTCPKQSACALTALIFTVVPARVVLPVLVSQSSAAPL